MSKYGHMVKYNGKYYNAGEEVPDNVQVPKSPIIQPQKPTEPPKVPTGSIPTPQSNPPMQPNVATATERLQFKK